MTIDEAEEYVDAIRIAIEDYSNAGMAFEFEEEFITKVLEEVAINNPNSSKLAELALKAKVINNINSVT